MSHKHKFIIYHLSFILFFASCDIINPEEGTPVFLEINDIQLTTNAATQGSNQHQINDVWAFVEGEPLGVFELPATIPVLGEGEQTITLFAGVRENGLRSAPTIYPLYDRYEEKITVIGGQTYQLTPTIQYHSNSVFELIEDFETANSTFLGGIQRITGSNNIKEGMGSGSIQLTESETEINSSVTFLELPTSGGLPVYLEMDYRTNVELEVGLVGFDVNTTTPNRSINFQEDLELSQFEGYQLAFRATTNDTGCGNVNSTNPEVLLDNIKLIRLQP